MSATVFPLMPYSYFRGKVCPSKEAVIPISSHSIQYGTACFSSVRGYYRDGKIRLFRMRDHFERLMNGVKIMGMDFSMTFDQFEGATHQLIAKNKPTTDMYFRFFVFSEEGVLSTQLDGFKFDWAGYMIPLGDYLDTSRGLKLMISSWRKFSDSMAPVKAKANGMYVNSCLARSQANTNGYDEALVMDQTGHVVEGSGENLLIVHHGEVITPPLGSAMLEGITWRTVVQLLKDEGIPVRFEPIDRSMIYTCDELMLTGTAAQVLFAESVDQRPISKKMGPVCTMLRKKFGELIEMKHKRSKEWVREYQF